MSIPGNIFYSPTQWSRQCPQRYVLLMHITHTYEYVVLMHMEGLGLGSWFFLSVSGFHRLTLRVSSNLGITTLALNESNTCLVVVNCGACLILYLLTAHSN